MYGFKLSYLITIIFKQMYFRPVRWSCKIRRLHLCRGVKKPTNGATCWPWVATRNVLGQDPDGWEVIDPATEWSMVYNTPLCLLLGQTGGRIGPIRSIGWSRHAPAHIYFLFFRPYYLIYFSETIPIPLSYMC